MNKDIIKKKFLHFILLIFSLQYHQNQLIAQYIHWNPYFSEELTLKNTLVTHELDEGFRFKKNIEKELNRNLSDSMQVTHDPEVFLLWSSSIAMNLADFSTLEISNHEEKDTPFCSGFENSDFESNERHEVVFSPLYPEKNEVGESLYKQDLFENFSKVRFKYIKNQTQLFEISELCTVDPIKYFFENQKFTALNSNLVTFGLEDSENTMPASISRSTSSLKSISLKKLDSPEYPFRNINTVFAWEIIDFHSQAFDHRDLLSINSVDFETSQFLMHGTDNRLLDSFNDTINGISSNDYAYNHKNAYPDDDWGVWRKRSNLAFVDELDPLN